MDLSPQSYVSINEILADVLKTVKDSDYKTSSKGWYTSQIQQALEELSFDTFFDEQHQAFDLPETLRLEMPKGAFNLIALYGFNGNRCSYGPSNNIYYKRNYINAPSGSGYVAGDKWTNDTDPFFMKRGGESSGPENLLYFGIQKGLLMFSPSCSKFQKVMMVYNGIMTDIGEAPIVPQFFRQAVKEYVTVRALEEKMTESVGTNEYGHWANLKANYESKLNHPYDGSWIKAERRAKSLNAKVRRDIKEYFTQLNY